MFVRRRRHQCIGTVLRERPADVLGGQTDLFADADQFLLRDSPLLAVTGGVLQRAGPGDDALELLDGNVGSRFRMQ
ncbi:MAG: hypothetical protein EA417_11750 [Gammaproteobacteria bacterium]|nr:MAG: hypothetical protein EA417_11750 [Gammaproteobacteria bacterium]